MHNQLYLGNKAAYQLMFSYTACIGMMGYGMAKAAVHQLVKGLAMKGAGLPPDTTALAILP